MPETSRHSPRVDAAPPVDALPPGPANRRPGLLGRVRYGLNFLLDPLGFVGGRFNRFGDMYFVGDDGDEPGLYVMRHPEHLEQVLIRNARDFDKAHTAFALLSEVLGEGLLTTDGETWRRQRRLVQPAFAKRRLEGYASAMAAEAAAEADRWVDGESRDMSEAMTEMTLRIVCRTLFGHDASADAAQVRAAMAGFQGALLGSSIPIPKAINPGTYRLRRASESLDSIIYAMIENRRRKGTVEGPADLLSMLLDARDEDGGRLEDREIRDQLVTLFLAGHETTANALTWTFHLLSQNPRVEARLHEELDAVLARRAATYADLPSLPYTAAVFDEAMRLYPPVYVLARKARRDVEVGGYTLPAGSEVVLWLWHTHRDSRWWDEPWAFRPERFLDETQSTERPKLAYAPFGAGPRACVGKVFAQIEGRVALATLAARWRAEASGQRVELRPRITLSPAGGLPMTLRRR